MKIAIPIFDGLTALDAVGPYEVLSRIPDASVEFVATRLGSKRTEQGALCLVAERSLGEVPKPDIVVVPGGHGVDRARKDGELVAWPIRPDRQMGRLPGDDPG